MEVERWEEELKFSKLKFSKEKREKMLIFSNFLIFIKLDLKPQLISLNFYCVVIFFSKKMTSVANS